MREEQEYTAEAGEDRLWNIAYYVGVKRMSFREAGESLGDITADTVRRGWNQALFESRVVLCRLCHPAREVELERRIKQRWRDRLVAKPGDNADSCVVVVRDDGSRDPVRLRDKVGYAAASLFAAIIRDCLRADLADAGTGPIVVLGGGQNMASMVRAMDTVALSEQLESHGTPITLIAMSELPDVAQFGHRTSTLLTRLHDALPRAEIHIVRRPTFNVRVRDITSHASVATCAFTGIGDPKSKRILDILKQLQHFGEDIDLSPDAPWCRECGGDVAYVPFDREGRIMNGANGTLKHPLEPYIEGLDLQMLQGLVKRNIPVIAVCSEREKARALHISLAKGGWVNGMVISPGLAHELITIGEAEERASQRKKE